MNLTGALIVVLRVPTNREVNIATPPSAFMHGPPVFAGKYFHVIKEQICQLIGTHLQYKRCSYRFGFNFFKECMSRNAKQLMNIVLNIMTSPNI